MPVELPAPLAALLPPELSLRRVLAYVALHGTAVGQLLLLHDGERLRAFVERAPGERLAALPLSGMQPLRLRGERLHLDAATGEQVVPIADWLELDLLRDFLAELPAEHLLDARLPGARFDLVVALLEPFVALVALLEHRSAQTPSAPERPMPLDIKRIQAELSMASTSEIVELVQLLRGTWSLGPMPSAGDSTATYVVTLLPYAGENKIGAIKAARELTGLGLADAKHLVEAGGSALRGAQFAEATHAKAELEAAGCVVEVKAG